MRHFAALLLCLPALAGAQSQDDDERPWTEERVVLPAPPASQNLIEVPLGARASSRALVDPGSLSVGSDGVVRFTLVVLASGGARNVSYEGMRCRTKERKAYAFGRPDGTWNANHNSTWVRVEPAGPNNPYATLFGDYFCQDRTAPLDAAAGLRVLRAGGRQPIAQ